jgi:hypothetical protein
MKNETIPRKDVDFNEVQGIIYSTVMQNIDKWGIDEIRITDNLTTACIAWNEARASYRDPARLTPLITFTKTEKRKVYEALLRILIRSLESNTGIPVEILRAMGIIIRDHTPTRAEIPTHYPAYMVDTSVIRQLIIHFWNMLLGNQLSRAKPHGVHGAEIRWAILAEAPASVDELVHSSFDTHTPLTLTFDENERGKTVYFCLRWENTRGEKGPWSEIVYAIIP